MQTDTFADAPARVYWEITRACSLACRHCRAEAAPCAAPNELDTLSGMLLLAHLSTATPQPRVVFTGGDPFARADLFLLIAYARSLGLAVSVSPSATPQLTEDAIVRLKEAGVEAISLSIDAANAERHDGIRGVKGCFDRTLAAAEHARRVGLPFQVNTLVSEETIDDLSAIEPLARSLGAARWSLFFLVNVGRGSILEAISAERCEQLLEWLAERSKVPGMIVTTTEAPHFRRVVAQKHLASPGRGHAKGFRDGNGVMFVSHDGEVYPSGFLPISAGNVRVDRPLTIYRESSLFRELRDVDSFHGKCGRCELRATCGGSRARAWVASGDVRGEDPSCLYEPRSSSYGTSKT